MKKPIILLALLCSCLVFSCKINTGKELKGTTGEIFQKPKGTLFIIGGGKRPPEMIKELIEVSNMENGAYAVILPMSSSEQDSAVFYAAKQFTELGVPAEKIKGFNFTKEQQDPARLDSLKKANLIYISGGDQSTFMDIVLNSPAHKAIKEAYYNGATIAGTSAGAAVMSKKMITGNEYKHPVYTGDFATIEADNIELKEGLGLLENAIIDQHFIQRMRMNRLLSTAIENPGEISIGIDESTALLVQNDSAKVVGNAQVILIENRNGSKRSKNGLLGADDLKVSVKLPGEIFLLKQ
ncbi:cyanophycinase [Salinimicrobium sp. TH3]|uniref:cyanophycinase n=1 Tax=Salinimicrobium sp. TH3 TaxID=2997342 RepID=UPI002272364C|nr:cyanophycinase [Salinimicrobium sp. TH3]MCY2685516.1 cyanophycinase [Salinimicrobium sp. TH3]